MSGWPTIQEDQGCLGPCLLILAALSFGVLIVPWLLWLLYNFLADSFGWPGCGYWPMVAIWAILCIIATLFRGGTQAAKQ